MTAASENRLERAPFFSVIILTHKRPELLQACLSSLLAAERILVREVLVVVNGNNPEDALAARSFSSRIPGMKIVPLARQSRGAARNAAAAQAQGDWLYFLDDDVEAPPGLFSDAARLLAEHGEAWILGGPNLTPPDSGLFERASGLVLESWIGAGPMRRRYASGPGPRWADEKSFALCNLCIRAAAFREAGLRFAPELASAEENLFVAQLRSLGRPALYAPSLAVYHRRRASLGTFLAQVYESGVGRRQIIRKLSKTAQAVFFFPAILVLYALFLAVIRPPAFSWALPALYSLAVTAEAVRRALRKKSAAVGLLFALLVPLSHAAYGAGFLTGRPLPRFLI